MWIWRKMQRIKWNEEIGREGVLQRVEEKTKNINDNKEEDDDWKKQHRREIEGTKRGRRRRKLIDNITVNNELETTD